MEFFNFFRKILSVDVGQTAPVFVLWIYFKVFVIIAIVDATLRIIWVLNLVKVERFGMKIELFVIFPYSSLLLFKPVLLSLSFFEIAIFECPLIRSEPRISGWKVWNKLFGEIVELKLMEVHSVHVVTVLRVRSLLPDLLAIASFAIDEKHWLVPATLNFVGHLVLSSIHITLDFVVVCLGPAFLVKFDVYILVFRAREISYVAVARGVHIDLTDN